MAARTRTRFSNGTSTNAISTVYVLNGWATFEYAGQGEKTIRKGDHILQIPMIPHREIDCSEDFEVLEIVAPADFKTRVVDPPQGAEASS